MNINIYFLIICLIVSKAVDWIFQSQWQANNKSKFDKKDDKYASLVALITHSAMYAIITTLIVGLILNWNSSIALWETKTSLIAVILFLTHLFIDTRIPVKWIMRFKGVTKEQINDIQNYGFLQLGIDQILHEITILVLSFFV